MPHSRIFQFDSLRAGKSVNEDTARANDQAGVYVVADGITRHGFSGSYPNPSPAWEASVTAAQTLSEMLPTAALASEPLRVIEKSFALANQALKNLNQAWRFWSPRDYWSKDLAGCVAACVVFRPQRTFHFAYLGDSGIAHFDAEGHIRWHSSDEVKPVITQYPYPELSVQDRTIRYRRKHRNRPNADVPTYGVLNGEESALTYVRIGQRTLLPGDMVVVYTDGAAPLILSELASTHLIAQGSDDEIKRVVQQHSSAGSNADEKTFIIIAT